ncbi:MAG: DUF2007 domain-containing protein [Acidobacteria bacterium]|nr:DUF2007 domain-containing protein [Acidobacteriota bacterium]
MWCPICKAEYVETITECSDCHVALVETLPEDSEEVEYIPGHWAVAAEFADEVAANLAEGLLQENGVECRLENQTFHAGPVTVSEDITHLRIWVEPENLEEAKRILEEAENYDLCSECGAVVLKEDESCAECGASLQD